MKKNLKIVVLFLIILTYKTPFCQRIWVDFDNGGETNQMPVLDQYSSNSFQIDFYGMFKNHKIYFDTLYDVLSLPGNFSKTCNSGFPQLPAFTFYVEVVDTPSIIINSKEYGTFQNYTILPFQISELLSESDSIQPFEKNDSIYNINEFYPFNNVSIGRPSICRGHRISTVVVYPVQYNPITKEIKYIKNIDITIENAGTVDSELDNVMFDGFLGSFVANYTNSTNSDNNIDLLIITPDEYETLLEP